MSDIGREQPFDFALFGLVERPVSGKAAIQELAAETFCRTSTLNAE